MIPELREIYNANFSERKYQRFLERLDYRCRTRIPFRISETPCFVPKALQHQIEEASVTLALQAHAAEYLKLSNSTLLPEYTVANQPPRSMFITVDFAVTRNEEGELEPKLIELQGFPSLMGFQLAFAELTQEHFELPAGLSYLNGTHTRSEFLAILHNAIVADQDPENVVLLELDPWNQKTCCDFSMIHEELGISVVDIRSVQKVGPKLFYERDGMQIPIHRIFNRAIVDEIQRKNIQIPFNWHDDLDVEWAGHPNWYFRISKFTLPFLSHATVPWTKFLNELDELPENLENYVLKPLYSFAGSGVIVSPEVADIRNIPHEQFGGYVLQEKVQYADVLNIPAGGTRAELRVMLIWLPDEEEPRPVMGLVRMGRSKLMGVDFNSDLRWVGAGCNFYEPA